MKTFASLIPGDTVFFIQKSKHFTQKNDEYGNVRESGINFFSIKIEDIKYDTCIRVNQSVSSFDRKVSYEIEMPINTATEEVFENQTRIYFTDEAKRDQLMASMALQEILKLERSIKDFEVSTKRQIQEVMANYHSVLNKNY